MLRPSDTKSQLTGQDLHARKIDGRRGRGQQRKRWSDNIADTMDMNLSKIQVMVKNRGFWCAAVHGIPKSWTQANVSSDQVTKHQMGNTIK